MRLFLFATILLLSFSCAGPEASDAVLCNDVITRLCAAPRCASVDAQLPVGDDCITNLTAKAGCGGDDFAFTTPKRDRILECRIPLLRAGDARTTVPGCDNVDELFFSCPDVVAFLRGTK